MLLHDGGRAPNPRRVQIFMKEKGIEIERVQYDINALEHKSEAFSQLNPFHTLPTLELDDGTIISETVAICRYLESLNGEPNLFGIEAKEQAIVEMWQRRTEFYFLMPVSFSFRHLHPGAKTIEPVQIEQWGKLNKGRAENFMKLLDGQLADRDFVACDRFTIVDISTFVACQFLKPAAISLKAELKHLNAWFERIKQRPSTAW